MVGSLVGSPLKREAPKLCGLAVRCMAGPQKNGKTFNLLLHSPKVWHSAVKWVHLFVRPHNLRTRSLNFISATEC